MEQDISVPTDGENVESVKATLVPLSDLAPDPNGVAATPEQRAMLIAGLHTLVDGFSSKDMAVVRTLLKEMSPDKQAEIDADSDSNIQEGANFMVDMCNGILTSIKNPSTTLSMEDGPKGQSVFLTDGEDASFKERIYVEPVQGAWKITYLDTILV